MDVPEIKQSAANHIVFHGRWFLLIAQPPWTHKALTINFGKIEHSAADLLQPAPTAVLSLTGSVFAQFMTTQSASEYRMPRLSY